MKYTLPFLLALDQPVCFFTIVSPITAKLKCVFYIESMLPVLVQDISCSGCNHATGSIMKYTLPFLLCIFIRLVATSSYHQPDL